MNKKVYCLLCVGIFISSFNLPAQKTDTAFFNSKAVSLLNQFNAIAVLDGSKKNKSEKDFCDSLAACLKVEGSFFYAFDTLKHIGRIQSADKKLNIFSWNIPQKNGYNNYYSIIQYYSKKDKQIYVYPLMEEVGQLKRNPQAVNEVNHWAGVLYYKIVETKYKGQVYYTLLGFDFNDILTNIKTIDVLTFNEQNYPIFPQRLFVYNGKPQNRIVYEYNERAQMMLEYNEHMKMIVADHLSPSRPTMEGQYQFYGPDFTYEGFSFEEGAWQQKSDIIVTN
jgi:hypothetical protein